MNREPKALQEARGEVNRHAFGTQEWEAAMEIVRGMVRALNDAAPKFVHTSRDGDVWSV